MSGAGIDRIFMSMDSAYQRSDNDKEAMQMIPHVLKTHFNIVDEEERKDLIEQWAHARGLAALLLPLA